MVRISEELLTKSHQFLKGWKTSKETRLQLSVSAKTCSGLVCDASACLPSTSEETLTAVVKFASLSTA